MIVVMNAGKKAARLRYWLGRRDAVAGRAAGLDAALDGTW